jgi:hypothetical protein
VDAGSREENASKQKALVRLKLRQIKDQNLNSRTLVEQALRQKKTRADRSAKEKKNPRGAIRAGQYLLKRQAYWR